MKRIALLFALVAVIAVPVAGTSFAASTKTIVGVAAGDPQLSTLVTHVKKAGLVKALSGTTKLTVFAPDNAAFAALPKSTLTKLAKDPKLLAKLLEYHVLPGVVPASKVVKLTSATTLEGATVQFSVKHGHAYINSSGIIQTNIPASNGIVHVINQVLTLP